MKEFIDSVKALGEKMTGKEVEGTELVDVVDDITEKYEGGGQGGGAGSNYLMTTMDYYQVVGKHIDVDSLIALLEHYNINIDEEISPQDQSLLGVILDLNHNKSTILFGYNVCSGGVEIRIFDTTLEDPETAYTFRNILTTNKEKIESFVIIKDLVDNLVNMYGVSQNIIINGIGDYGHYNNYITVEEALSIFK